MTAAKLPTGHGQSLTDKGLPLHALAQVVQVKAGLGSLKTRAACLHLIDVAAAASERGDDETSRTVLQAALDLAEDAQRCRDAAWTAERTGAYALEQAEALTRGDLCADHGDAIRGLQTRLDDVVPRLERADKARLILLAWHTECARFVSMMRGRRGVAGLPPPETIVSWMERNLPKVYTAHELTLNPPNGRTAE